MTTTIKKLRVEECDAMIRDRVCKRLAELGCEVTRDQLVGFPCNWMRAGLAVYTYTAVKRFNINAEARSAYNGIRLAIRIFDGEAIQSTSRTFTVKG
jgi:hypothetical protein